MKYLAALLNRSTCFLLGHQFKTRKLGGVSQMVCDRCGDLKMLTLRDFWQYIRREIDL